MVQTTSWALMAVVASVAPMASMAWMDLMALELKRERKNAVVW